MALFTVTEVAQAAATASRNVLLEGTEGRRILEARMSEYFSREAAIALSSPVSRFDIFLSHAYQDRVTVAGVYSILRSTGFTVYVDWINDPQLSRGTVSAATADVLRSRMHQCKSLLYVTAENSVHSKWMPWECGYFDGFDSKTLQSGIQFGHVAILPVLDSAHSHFLGQEYLGLYPFAQKANYSRRNLNIHNQSNPSRNMHFDAWILNGHP